MRKIRLLLIGNFLSNSTGTRSICEDLSDHLRAHGWPMITVSRRPKRFWRLTDMGFSILHNRHNYDVAYLEVYSGAAFIWAELCSVLLKRIHKPFILALHGGGLGEFATKNPRRMKLLLNRAARVTTPSLFLQDGLRASHSDIRYIPNAIDICQYPFRVREKPGPNLVWLRAFHKIYQPELAIRTLAELTNEFPAITLTMCGPDKNDGSLDLTMQEARRLHVAEHVSIVGQIRKSDVPHWLNTGDIFLNTTLYESFGVSVMEAASCGLPIITTRVGELKYLWEDNSTALLVEPGMHVEMGTAVRRVLREPGLSKQLSQNARVKAQQYDWGEILPRWERLFGEVASV